jgi:hypothetical protein
MALVFLVVLTTTHLENLHFIVTTVCHNSYQYRCTFDQWRTKLNGVARSYCEYLIDGDFGTNVCRYLFYFKFFASDNFILFATGFYDRVHDMKPHQMLKDFPGRSRGNRRLYMDCFFSSKGKHNAAGSWYVDNSAPHSAP